MYDQKNVLGIILYENVTINGPMAEDVFDIDIPPGVELQDNT